MTGTELVLLLLVCGSVWAFFKGVVFIARHGLPSMLKLRGEAVVEWQDCDRQPRNAFDEHVDDAILLTHQATPEVGSEEWWTAREAELADEKQIVKHLRRMERWSR